ncbi:hypothetical protein ACF0H5_006158 [Mactra antiquata]
MGDITLNSAHNFGIYTKSGKRSIFQIDFSCKRISLIERGKIGKSYDFQNLEQYDSEDNLHIVIKFRSNKTLEFDADTAEEKYTICRLLGIILGPEPDDNVQNVDSRDNGSHANKLSTKKQIIKEGVLDKKGNTKIPTWSKRKLQVCPGEFSYYKPGDEVALNLVQLWENSTTVTPNGNNGFTVSVRDRSYFFRLGNEKGMNTELERDHWIQSFKQASQRKRATFLLLEQSNFVNNNRQGLPLQSLSSMDEDDENCYYNQNTSRSTLSSSSDSNSSRDVLEGLEKFPYAINELDEVLNEEATNGGPKSNIALSVVKKSSPVLATPTKSRPRPPAITGIKGSFKSEDQSDPPLYDFIPEPDYSPPPSPTETTDIPKGIEKKHSSGIYKRVIPEDPEVSRKSGAYDHVIRQNPPNSRASGEYTKAIRQAPAPGAVNVMSNVTEFPQLRKTKSKDSFDKDINNERVQLRDKNERIPEVNAGSVNVTNSDTNEKIVRTESKFPPPAPSGPRASPKPPAPPPPLATQPPACPAPPAAPPPPCQVPAPPPTALPLRSAGKGKLKQVHWNRTPKPMVVNSIWERPHDFTAKINVKLLEEQFAVKERDLPTTPGPKSPSFGKQQPLVDAKRAQILDIFLSSLKNEGISKLVTVLNSVTEDDSFPVEKLTTIRRYQPTEDEIDMYKAYSHKKHELHPVDQFMVELCEIPCLSVRIDICLTLWDFPWQYDSTCQLVDQVHTACDEILNSQMLVLVLEYLLAIGNHLNRNWSDSHVTQGFQVTSLDKVLSVRGKDSGYTLVHFLVEQLRQSDPGLLQWTETVQTVKKCEQVSVKSVAAESEVLKCDLSKVKKHLKILKSHDTSSRQGIKFQQDAQNLCVEYEMKLEKMDRRCGELQNKYRKILTKFGEPMYQRSDQMFAVVADFHDKFKSAIKDLDTKERKASTS